MDSVLTTLPMGWTNSVPIFHDDVTHILQPEIPHVTQPYIDDVPVRALQLGIYKKMAKKNGFLKTPASGDSFGNISRTSTASFKG